MRGRILLAVVAVAAAVFTSSGAGAVTPCPDPVCTVITGTVVDPHGNPAPSYGVVAQRADGYNESATTAADGSFAFHLPKATTNNCYQVAGLSDAYYSNTSLPAKVCASAGVTLRPFYRINGVSGHQKTYIADAATARALPVQISALSRSYPAPFDGDTLPWEIEYADPRSKVEVTSEGTFPDPTIRKIASGVWQYLWTTTLPLPSGASGYYDMDWGRDGSPFSPMMECRMVWFGYGTSSVSPSSALPGTVLTLSGQRLGTRPGSVVIKGSGAVTTISGAGIVSWSDDQVKFLLPPGAKTGWATAVSATGVPTNAQYVKVDP